jgi:hypothetical protein
MNELQIKGGRVASKEPSEYSVVGSLTNHQAKASFVPSTTVVTPNKEARYGAVASSWN